MPQMEFADYAPQVVWLVISFAVLYLLMARLALPHIATVLQAREERVEKDLERAEVLEREAEAAERAYEHAAAETRARAQAVAAEAREKLQAEQAGRLAALEAELAKKYRAAEAGIAEAREKARAGLRDLAADLAQATAERLLGAKVDAKAAAKAVDAARKG